MFKLRNILFLLVAAMAVVGAGCGEDDESSAKGPPLSKPEFVKRANAICARAKSEGQEWVDDYAKRNSPGDNSQAEISSDIINGAFLPSARKATVGIEALAPPVGDDDQIDAFLEANREAIETAMEDDEVPAELDVPPSFEEPGKLAREYGIDKCAYR